MEKSTLNYKGYFEYLGQDSLLTFFFGIKD